MSDNVYFLSGNCVRVQQTFFETHMKCVGGLEARLTVWLKCMLVMQTV